MDRDINPDSMPDMRWKTIKSEYLHRRPWHNLTYCFLAKGVKHTGHQHLDANEDVEVHVLPQAEVFAMLQRGDFLQALMAAPLWKYFYDKDVAK